MKFSTKSLTFSFLICAPNLYFAQKLLRKAKFARGCQNCKKLLQTPKVAQKLPSTIGTGLNGDRAVWLVYTTDTNARGFWLVKRTLGWKNFMAEELARNHSIIRFDVILQHDWPIEQWLLHIRVFFSGKTKSPCFDLSKTTNEHVPKPFFKVIWKSLYHVPSSTVVFQMNKYKWNITTMQFPRRIWIYLYRYLRLISFEIKKITLKGFWRIMKYNLMP